MIDISSMLFGIVTTIVVAIIAIYIYDNIKKR